MPETKRNPTKTERLARERLLKNFRALEDDTLLNYYVRDYVPEVWTTLAQDIDVEEKKVKLSLWVDESVAKFYRATGKGYHGRINRVLGTYRDADGNYLIGSNTYRLNVPEDVPVEQFWQVPLYEVSTRALIQNEQGRTSLSSTRELAANDDGSFDLWFAPELPDGVPESNWVQTIPDEGWFTMPRLYAPLEPALNKEWRWNDIERVK